RGLIRGGTALRPPSIGAQQPVGQLDALFGIKFRGAGMHRGLLKNEAVLLERDIAAIACPMNIIRFRHSCFIERTKRSAYAFRFGDIGGSRMTCVPLSSISLRNCTVYLACFRYRSQLD
ncbi:MAG: hypothetical protein ABIS45_07970, partial [Burkholderiales bacterium]